MIQCTERKQYILFCEQVHLCHFQHEACGFVWLTGRYPNKLCTKCVWVIPLRTGSHPCVQNTRQLFVNMSYMLGFFIVVIEISYLPFQAQRRHIVWYVVTWIYGSHVDICYGQLNTLHVFFINESSMMLIMFKSPEPNLFRFFPALGIMLPFVRNGKYKSILWVLLTLSTNRVFQWTTLQLLCLLQDSLRDIHVHEHVHFFSLETHSHDITKL